jgi:hypothetical protein
MSKERQFEYIEARIRQAVKNSRPAFNIKAWAEMEALLDKEEKKQKPFYWWIVLVFLIVGGAYLFKYYNYDNAQPGNTAENILNVTDTKPNAKGAEYSTTDTVKNTNAKNVLNSDEMKFNNAPSSNETASHNLKSTNNKRTANLIFNDAEMPVDKSTDDDNKKISINKAGTKKVTIAGSNPLDDTAVQDVKNNGQAGTTGMEESTKPGLRIVQERNLDSGSVANSKNRKAVTDANTAAKKNEPTAENKKSSRFYFLASIGPNIGSVKLFSFDNSAVAAKYGAGAGYQLSKKLSLQTGIYAGRQIYLAGSNDYHPKRPLPDTLKLVSAAANCLVYEIPITIRYDIFTKSTLSYYTSVSLSSYIMKKEEYDVSLVSTNGYNVQRYPVFTGNKHLFSTLLLSAGIEKKISNLLSLQLEPSVSLPLSGVGQGKVKLFSSAIMLGVKFRPFRK